MGNAAPPHARPALHSPPLVGGPGAEPTLLRPGNQARNTATEQGRSSRSDGERRTRSRRDGAGLGRPRLGRPNPQRRGGEGLIHQRASQASLVGCLEPQRRRMQIRA
ncbi:hypothetical protein PVAP13_1KG343200 [Panicum virgatum]|uniref:Uncharacterized protein n=1 Tax=Panicum virgatum TaxID=38727 RepID=A0A8T0XQ42_PANVG|nr:hypothetical protein PVAP13_1KG343200 [Panicum virgatum]